MQIAQRVVGYTLGQADLLRKAMGKKAAQMTSEMHRTDAVVKFINETAQMGIKILPPDINESNYAFTVVGTNIRFGLGAVKGVGSSAIDSILEARRRAG